MLPMIQCGKDIFLPFKSTGVLFWLNAKSKLSTLANGPSEAVIDRSPKIIFFCKQQGIL